MELIALIPIILIVGFICFSAGSWSKVEPSEEEMLRRLINERVERKLRTITTEQLDREIEETAQRLVRPVPY